MMSFENVNVAIAGGVRRFVLRNVRYSEKAGGV